MHSEPIRVSDARGDSVNVWAGKRGFYGQAFGLWLGPLRDTVESAQKDADFAADCIKQSSSGVLI